YPLSASMHPRPLFFTLFPYTTLFRSRADASNLYAPNANFFPISLDVFVEPSWRHSRGRLHGFAGYCLNGPRRSVYNEFFSQVHSFQSIDKLVERRAP